MTNKTITVQSPGRINIIGEHTDYNDGYVLPAAVNKTAVFKLRKNDSSNIASITATALHETFSFDLNAFKPLAGGWQNYIMGVVHELQELGAAISGFEGSFAGNVPIGGGMSSSAALECSLAFGLNELFELGFDRLQLIHATQMAEHHFVGIKCGIMDQFASMMGRADQAILLDCRSLEYRYIPVEMGKYEFLLLNTNVSHNLASSAYNERREACENGVIILQKKYPAVKSLRDVDLRMLATVGDSLPSTVLKRCEHVITENHRVLAAADALLSGSYEELGKLLFQSHFSLRDNYEVSCAELDFLVDFTLDKPYIMGSRMMGGGFGGCTLNIVESVHRDKFIEAVALAYHQQFNVELTPYSVAIADGTNLIKQQ